MLNGLQYGCGMGDPTAPSHSTFYLQIMKKVGEPTSGLEPLT